MASQMTISRLISRPTPRRRLSGAAVRERNNDMVSSLSLKGRGVGRENLGSGVVLPASSRCPRLGLPASRRVPASAR